MSLRLLREYQLLSQCNVTSSRRGRRCGGEGRGRARRIRRVLSKPRLVITVAVFTDFAAATVGVAAASLSSVTVVLHARRRPSALCDARTHARYIDARIPHCNSLAFAQRRRLLIADFRRFHVPTPHVSALQ
jgi:hypothetical protein